MPKRISDSEFNTIMQAIERFSEEALIADISLALNQKINRRTLQRRLAALVEQNQIEVEGRGKGTRYKKVSSNAKKVETIVETETLFPVSVGLYSAVSDEARQIIQYVQPPIQNRTPVGYQSEFIETYQPNKTFYLTDSVRKHLLKTGNMPPGIFPAGTYTVQIYNRLLIDLTWNSSRLEGNTYSLLETERLLATGEATEGKDVIKTQMILNHKAAIELIGNSSTEIDFNRYTICNLRVLLSDNLLPDPAASGRLRE